MPADESKRRQELTDRLELPERDLRRKLRQYSTGMKRKLGLIQALEGDPPLLILDEPTEGLDPLMQESFYALLAEAKQRGTTVFMSSHVLSEVERVCDRIALLREGELVLSTHLENMRRLAARCVRVLSRAMRPCHLTFRPGTSLWRSPHGAGVSERDLGKTWLTA